MTGDQLLGVATPVLKPLRQFFDGAHDGDASQALVVQGPLLLQRLGDRKSLVSVGGPC